MKPVFHMFLECVNNNAVYPRSIDLSNQKKWCEKARKNRIKGSNFQWHAQNWDLLN